MSTSQTEYPQIGAGDPSDADVIDVRTVMRLIRRRLKVIVAIIAVSMLVAVAMLASSEPLYSATSELLLDRTKLNVVKIEEVSGDAVLDSAGVDTEVQVLQSRALAGRVADALKLVNEPSFNSALQPPGMMDKVKNFIGGAPPPADPASPAVITAQRERIITKLLRNLKVRRVGLTYAIDLTYTAPDPKAAALVANEFARQYLLNQVGTKTNATANASSWLEQRVAALRAQLEATERAVQEYKAANGLLEANGNQSLTQQEISALNGQLATARANQAEAEARLNTARRQLAGGSSGGDVGEALSSPVVSNLRSQRAEASRKVADLQSKYGERHPELVTARKQLADIDEQIEEEIQRVISNLDAQAQVARQRTASIQGSLGASRGTLQANSAAGVRLAELERNAESVRTLYQAFLDRYRETTAQAGAQQPEARIIAPATTPNGPSYPKPALFVGGGLAAGLLLAISAAVFLELLEQSLSTASDVKRRLRVPSLGSIPELASTLEKDQAADRNRWPPDYVLAKPHSAFAEAFRSIRASLMATGEPIRVLALSSALPGEGKTTSALCLARTLAMGGARVLVVDCDLRRRAVGRILPDTPEAGLVEVLTGQVDWRSVIHHDAASGADFLPVSGRPLTVADLFDTPAMDKLLAELRGVYSLVILDTAPVLAIAETRVIAAKADAVLFLVRWRKTPGPASEAAIRQLEAVGAHVAGAVLTQVDVREQARTGFGDPGLHYKAYRAYYAA